MKAGAINRVSDQLGMHPETLRSVVRQAEVDGGVRPGTTIDDAKRLAELRRVNEILRTVGAFRGSGARPQTEGGRCVAWVVQQMRLRRRGESSTG